MGEVPWTQIQIGMFALSSSSGLLLRGEAFFVLWSLLNVALHMCYLVKLAMRSDIPILASYFSPG